MTIGIIGEGISDFYTLRSILQGFTGDKAFTPAQLQPKGKEPAGWTRVFDYCGSSDFRGAFAFNDFIVVQIDTDFLHHDGLPDKYKLNNVQELSSAQVLQQMQAWLTEAIGTEFYEANQNKIIFAIAVEQIECWFLGIYYSDKRAGKTTQCLNTLNQALKKKEGFTIDEKQEKYYDKIASPFRKRKDLMQHSAHNESFHAFIEELSQKLPATDAEETST